MSPRPRFTLSALLALALALAGLLAPAQAQVLVYKFKLAPDRSVNLDFYNAGWFVVSPLGGTGSFIFTRKSTDGNLYAKAASTGTLFTGVTEEGKQKAVINAAKSSGTESTKAAYLAFGNMNKSMRFVGPGFDIETDVATKLTGMAIASSPEDNTVTTTTDSTSSTSSTSTTTTTTDSTSTDSTTTTTETVSTGFAGVFDWSVTLDTKTTSASNAKGNTIDETITDLETTLKQSDYTEEDSTVKNLEITTDATLTPDATPNNSTGDTYTIAASGGVTAYKWSLINLPSNGAFSIDSSTGKLTVKNVKESDKIDGIYEPYQIHVKVTDSATAPDAADKVFYLTVKPKS